MKKREIGTKIIEISITTNIKISMITTEVIITKISINKNIRMTIIITIAKAIRKKITNHSYIESSRKMMVRLVQVAKTFRTKSKIASTHLTKMKEEIIRIESKTITIMIRIIIINNSSKTTIINSSSIIMIEKVSIIRVIKAVRVVKIINTKTNRNQITNSKTIMIIKISRRMIIVMKSRVVTIIIKT